jgi:sterol 3beta-glucosyltransferase
VIAIGSRGDVQPLVALGLGLRRVGHEVRMATHPRYESLVPGRELEFAPVAEGDLSRGPKTREGKRWVQKRRRAVPDWIGFLRDAESVAHRRLADCWGACEGTEAIIVSVLGTLLGYQIAEQLRVPLVRAYYAPLAAMIPSLHPPEVIPAWLTRGISRASQAVSRQVLWQLSRPWVNSARREVLALPPLPVRDPYSTLDRQRVPLLYGYSPMVFPRPPDWGDSVHVTGYWFVDRPDGWRPSPALLAFLAAGPPPVFVSFGDLAVRDPAGATDTIVRALRRAGQRGIIVRAGPYGLGGTDLPPDVFSIDTVPYEWLFSRAVAAVHHGGAGTTAMSLRTGLPSVIVPAFADQPFWARRVYELGVGPPPIPRRQLSVDPLAEAIRVATTDPRMRERAATLAQNIQSEDGVARAVEAFEREVVAGHGRPGSVSTRRGTRSAPFTAHP